MKRLLNQLNQWINWIHLWTFLALWSIWIIQTIILVGDLLKQLSDQKRKGVSR